MESFKEKSFNSFILISLIESWIVESLFLEDILYSFEEYSSLIVIVLGFVSPLKLETSIFSLLSLIIIFLLFEFFGKYLNLFGLIINFSFDFSKASLLIKITFFWSKILLNNKI